MLVVLYVRPRHIITPFRSEEWRRDEFRDLDIANWQVMIFPPTEDESSCKDEKIVFVVQQAESQEQAATSNNAPTTAADESTHKAAEKYELVACTHMKLDLLSLAAKLPRNQGGHSEALYERINRRRTKSTGRRNERRSSHTDRCVSAKDSPRMIADR